MHSECNVKVILFYTKIIVSGGGCRRFWIQSKQFSKCNLPFKFFHNIVIVVASISTMRLDLDKAWLVKCIEITIQTMILFLDNTIN